MSVVMKRDDRIDYLKALACIAVVCCHRNASKAGFQIQVC